MAVAQVDVTDNKHVREFSFEESYKAMVYNRLALVRKVSGVLVSPSLNQMSSIFCTELWGERDYANEKSHWILSKV